MMITRQFESESSASVHTARFNPETGESSCSCAGWRFKRHSQARGCKHTRILESEHSAARAESIARVTTLARRDAVAGAEAHVVTFRASAATMQAFDRQAAADTRASALSVPKPMLASAMTLKTFAEYCRDGAWVMEEKFDGHRVTVRKVGQQIAAWSRPRTGKAALVRVLPPAIVEALRHLPDGVYDGELVAEGARSRSSRVTALETEKALVLFDALEIFGQSITARPYEERREALRLAVAHYTAAVTHGTRIRIPDVQPVSVEALAAIWDRGGEGAILKRRASLYHAGKRSPEWVKVKRHGTAALVITGFEAGKRGPYSVTLLRTADGQDARVKTRDDVIDAIALNPKAFIGRRLVIAYCELTPDGKFMHGVWDHFAGAGE